MRGPPPTRNARAATRPSPRSARPPTSSGHGASCAHDALRDAPATACRHTEAVDVALHSGRASGSHFRREIQRRSAVSRPAWRIGAAGAEVHQHDAPAVARRMTFCALTSRCSSPAACTARERLAQVECRSSATRVRGERALLADDRPRACGRGRTPSRGRRARRSRAAPKTVTTFGWRTRASSRPSSSAIVDVGVRVRRPAQQLERHFAIERGIPGPVHVAEGAAREVFEQIRGDPSVRGSSLRLPAGIWPPRHRPTVPGERARCSQQRGAPRACS